MERCEIDHPQALELWCVECRRSCYSAGGFLTVSGFVCDPCIERMNRKALCHAELLALLRGELAYVRGRPFQIFQDRIERIH